MKRYTHKELDFIKRGYVKYYIPELTKRFNLRFKTQRSECSIKSVCTNNRFLSNRKKGNPKGTLLLFTKKQADFIKKNYVRLSQKELTLALNKKFISGFSASQVKYFITNHKIHSGRTGRYKKRHIPFTAGTKGVVKPNSGNFKKGNMPANLKKIGSERIGKDGYVLIKVRTRERDSHTGFSTRYKAKHVVLWERKHGPVPKDSVIIFKDSDIFNFFDDNLICITRAELLQLNRRGYKKLRKEVKPSAFTLMKLDTKIYQHKKKGRK